MAEFQTSLRQVQKRKGQRRPLLDRFGGADFSPLFGKLMHKIRIFDRRTDPATYFEQVTDPETGKVIHHCSELLSKHIGHGSAKFR